MKSAQEYATAKPQKPILHTTRIETYLGAMIAVATAKGLCLLQFTDSKWIDRELRQLTATFNTPLIRRNRPHFDTLRNQLKEYFDGERRLFDIPLDPVGTPFQQRVWRSLLEIPYGCTASYRQQAELIGKPTAVRAVARANGKNKISILLPCHRVIGSDGTLTGYAGGLRRKEKLLDFERENFLRNQENPV